MKLLKIQIPERQKLVKSFNGYDVIYSIPLSGNRVITFSNSSVENVYDILKILCLPLGLETESGLKFINTCFAKFPIPLDIVNKVKEDLGEAVVFIDNSLSSIICGTSKFDITNTQLNLLSDNYLLYQANNDSDFMSINATTLTIAYLHEIDHDKEVFIFNYLYNSEIGSKYKNQKHSNSSIERFKYAMSAHVNRKHKIKFGEIELIEPTYSVSLSMPDIGNTISSYSVVNKILNKIEPTKFKGFTKLGTTEKLKSLKSRIEILSKLYTKEIKKELNSLGFIKEKTSSYKRPQESILHLETRSLQTVLSTKPTKSIIEEYISGCNYVQKYLLKKLNLNLQFVSNISSEEKEFITNWITLYLIGEKLMGIYTSRTAYSCLNSVYPYRFHNIMVCLSKKAIASLQDGSVTVVTNGLIFPRITKKIKTKPLDPEIVKQNELNKKLETTLLANVDLTVDDLLDALKLIN